MSLVQDVFGTAPKSVLNKPFLHLQHTVAIGSIGGATVVGDNLRPFNNVATNEIQGASLNPDGSFVLPAGQYYIDTWQSAAIYTTPANQFQSVLQANDSDFIEGTGDRAIGRSDAYYAQYPTIRGKINISAATTFKLILRTNDALIDGLGRDYSPGSGATTSLFAEACIWKLDSNIETPVISDPTMTLARPLMHVRHEEPLNTSVLKSAGATDATLNVVKTNEIAGASLAANQVTLPAGEYWVESIASFYTSNTQGLVKSWLAKADDTPLIDGQGTTAYYNTNPNFSGRLVLTETTTIKVVDYSGSQQNSGWKATNQGTVEVYRDLKIWQLDAVNKQPVIVNDKLYPLPGNVIVTGNMHGLEYEYTAPNVITVQAGICMDSVNETVLTLTNPQPVTIPGGTDTVYNLFLTNDNQLVKTDTDVDGANLPAQDKRRWIGFVKTKSDGTVADFTMNGNRFHFASAADCIFFAGFGSTTYINVTSQLAAVVPVSRVEELFIAIESATASGQDVMLSIDGINGISRFQHYNNITSTIKIYSNGADGYPHNPVQYDPRLQAKIGTGAADLCAPYVRMKR